MDKFSQMTHTRPELVAVKAAYQEYIERLKQASTYEEMRDLYLAQKDSEAAWSTMLSIANIRNTVDTRDEFHEAEMKYFNQETPALGLLEHQRGIGCGLR